MRRTGKVLSDHECRDLVEEIVTMTLNSYNCPLRDGFNSRMAQAGFDLTRKLMAIGKIVPGEENEQTKINLEENRQ